MSKKSSRRKALYLILALSLIVIVVIFYVWSSRPVTDFPSSNDVMGAQTESKLIEIEGSSFKFNVSDQMTIKNYDKKPHGRTSEQLLITSKNSTVNNPISDQLGVTVGDIDMEGINELSDVKLRQRQVENYSTYSNDFIPEDAIAFKKDNSEGYEISVFWKYNQKYSSIVVSGTSSRADNLEELLRLVIDSWQWQEQ